MYRYPEIDAALAYNKVTRAELSRRMGIAAPTLTMRLQRPDAIRTFSTPEIMELFRAIHMEFSEEAMYKLFTPEEVRA